MGYRTLRHTLIVLMTVLHTTQLLKLYSDPGSGLEEYDLSLYKTALNGDLVSAGLRKSVSLNVGDTCSSTTDSICIRNIAMVEVDTPIEDLNIECMNVRCQSVSCTTKADLPQPQDVSDGSSLERLLAGENVFQAELDTSTYLLNIRHQERVSDVVIKGGEPILVLELERGSGEQVSINLVYQKVNEHHFAFAYKMATTFEPEFARLYVDGSSQFAVLYNRIDMALAITINGTLLYHDSNCTLVGIKSPLSLNRHRYQVLNWSVYNDTLTTQELMTINGGSLVHVVPDNSCVCPRSHPLLQAQPLSANTTEPWSALSCTSLSGNNSPVSRVPHDYHVPEFINDDDINTFWVSKDNVKLSKMTIDLGTGYQIVQGKLTLMTLPEYIVITKQTHLGGPEEVLYTMSPNCSDDLPEELSLSKSNTSACTEVRDDSSSPLLPFITKGSSLNASSLLLQWSHPLLLNMEGWGAPENDRYLAHIAEGRLLSRYVHVYLYGHLFGATHHTINEFTILGSCGCSQSGECSLKNKPVTSLRNRRQASGPAPPGENGVPPVDEGGSDDQPPPSLDPNLIRDLRSVNVFRFKDVYGFSCKCNETSEGPLCNKCITGYFFDKEVLACTKCGCAEGSSADSCDDKGVCTCDLAGAGKLMSQADDKCHSFISSISPDYGPVAGGTVLGLSGAWLDKIDKVSLGDTYCTIDPYRKTGTYATCVVPARAEPETVSLFLYDSNEKINFTYKANPNITAIERTQSTVSGGLPIVVVGTNLDSVAEPQLIIKMICKSNRKKIETFKQDCQVTSYEKMVCSSPNVTDAVNAAVCAAPSGSRVKRDARSDTYDYLVGFKLDGFKDYANLDEVEGLQKFGKLTVYDDPAIFSFSEGDAIRRLPTSNRLLEIHGERLLSGVTADDYAVKIGEGLCKVTSVTDNTITCNVPEELPPASPDNFKMDSSGDSMLPAVEVQVGNIHKQVGYMSIEDDDNASTSNDWKIAVGVLVPLIVILFIVIACILLLKRQRRTLQKKQSDPEKDSRYVTGPHGSSVLFRQNNDLNSDDMESLKPWLLAQEHLELGSALGQGQFGKVFLGMLDMKSGTKRKVAVKTIKAELLTTDVNAVRNFIQEAILMKNFHHPNVLSLIGVVVNDQQMPMVVIPYMARGDLKQVLKDDTLEFTVGDLIHLGLQAANGMDYLAKKKFIHRDLAARNCMVDDQFYIKIADFGLSHNIYSEDYYRVQDTAKPLPVKWMAIESLASGKYTVESDVWSYGVLLWEVITRGATPYPGINNYEVKEHLKIGNRLTQPEYCPDEVYELMLACWSLTPEERPTFTEISETLATFMNQGTDYERVQTKDIEDDYYLEPVSGEDEPYFQLNIQNDDRLEEEDGKHTDYDEPIPVESAPVPPSSPKSTSDTYKYYTATEVISNENTNNSNNTDSSSPSEQLRRKPLLQSSTDSNRSSACIFVPTDSYLYPKPATFNHSRPNTTVAIKETAGYIEFHSS